MGSSPVRSTSFADCLATVIRGSVLFGGGLAWYAGRQDRHSAMLEAWWPGGLIGEPKKSMMRVSFVALFFTPWLWPEHLPDDGRVGAWLQGARNRSSAGNKSPHQLTWWEHYDRMLS